MLQGGGADVTRGLLHYAVQSQHNLTRPLSCIGVRGGAAGGGTELLAGMSRVLSRWGQWGLSLTSGCTMALGWTQPVTGISAYGYLLVGKGGRCVGHTALPPLYADFLKILRASSSWKSKGPSRPV